MSFRTFSACFSVLCCCLARATTTLWVDGTCGRAQAAGTESDPFLTIQQAVDAADAGTCIKVRPGDYATGETLVNNSLSRVYVKKMNLTIESTDGPEKTRILGKHDTSDDAVYGMGDEAVRCVFVEPDCRLVLKGFTLANGASRYVKNNSGGSQDVPANRGGAVANNYSKSENAFTLVDCIITNNVGTRGGAVYGGRAIRCRFLDNHASNFGHAVRETVLYHCLLARNSPPEGMSNTNDGIGVIAWGQGVYNCTVSDNQSAAFVSTSQPICNSVVVGNRKACISTELTWFTNCIVEAEAVYDLPAENRCQYGTYAEFHSPATRDYRLDAEALSLGAADRKLADAYPQGCDQDVAGNPMPSDGTLHCGAFQEHVTARARLTFSNVTGTSGTMYVNGAKLGTHPGTFAAAETLPAVIQVHYVCTDPDTTGVYTYKCGSRNVCPSWAGDAWLAFEDGEELAVSVTWTPKFWVDQATGRDADDVTGTAADAYASIQYAVEKTAETSPRVICVRPGTYGTGEGVLLRGVTNRVALVYEYGTVRLVSSEGRDRTTILGASDPNSPSGDGRGPAAMRCLALEGPQYVSGFTLRGGRGGWTSDDRDCDMLRGGAVIAYSLNSVITDCLVTNCCASRGAVSWCARFERCVFTDNEIANNGMIRAAELVSCLSYGNKIKNSQSFGQDSQMYQCTVADETGTGSASAITASTTAAVGLVLGEVENGLSIPARSTYTNQLVESVVMTADSASKFLSDTVFKDDPYFAEDGSYRVCGAGRAAGLLSAGNVRSWTDVYGVPYTFDAAGKTVAGAVATPAPGVVAYSDRTGGISPEGLTVPEEGADTIVFEATLGDTRACLGFTVNGEFRETDETDGNTLTLTVDPASAYRVSPVYATNFYVNVATGNDSYPGTAAKPLKTLAEASARAVSGDVVTVAPGVYKTGTYTPTRDALGVGADVVIPARVFVPSGVVFESEGGRATAETTIIEGEQDWTTDSGIGLGPAAVHGAYMAAGSVLRGFTLRGCGTRNENTEFHNDCGGGVWAINETARIEWCTFTNNAAYRGGAARNGTFTGCRFLCNRSYRLAPSTRDGFHYGCFFDGNDGDTTSYGWHYENCTFGPNNVYPHPDGYATSIHCMTSNGDHCRGVVNTVIAKGHLNASYVSNVVMAVNLSHREMNQVDVYNLVKGDVSMDGAGRPTPQSAAIDAGDAALASPDVLTADLGGGQRIYNNALDCGAYEYDWRAAYARKLSASGGFTVLSAPPTCKAETDGVRLFDGTLAATWANAADTRTRISVAVHVTGAGMLTIWCNGEEIDRLTAGDGAVKREYLSVAKDLTFLYARAETEGDAPGALLTSVALYSGLSLVIR